MPEHLWLSYPLSEKAPVYGGSKGFHAEPVNRIAVGNSCNTETWHLPNHCGTHVDAPRHFYEEGWSLDLFPPEFWVFKQVELIEIAPPLSSNLLETGAVLPLIKNNPELLIIKTGICYERDTKSYWENNPGLDPELGPALRDSFPALRAVGIDSISISSWQDRALGRKAHRAFLDPARGQEFILVEDMDLRLVSRDKIPLQVIIQPLLAENADGAPCSILALIEDA